MLQIRPYCPKLALFTWPDYCELNSLAGTGVFSSIQEWPELPAAWELPVCSGGPATSLRAFSDRRYDLQFTGKLHHKKHDLGWRGKAFMLHSLNLKQYHYLFPSFLKLCLFSDCILRTNTTGAVLCLALLSHNASGHKIIFLLPAPQK